MAFMNCVDCVMQEKFRIADVPTQTAVTQQTCSALEQSRE